MVTDEIKNKIKILFSEKKYENVIELTEKFTLLKERPAGLLNILGISYFLKKKGMKRTLSLRLLTLS